MPQGTKDKQFQKAITAIREIIRSPGRNDERLKRIWDYLTVCEAGLAKQRGSDD